MKALIKGGLCLALSWLANGAGAQELPVNWRASTAKNPAPIAVVSSPGSTGAKSDTLLRPVSLSTPTPLDGGSASALRPTADPFAPIIRAQAADDKTVQPVPTLEIGGSDKQPAQRLPKDKGYTPPPPRPVTPSPLFSNLGIMAEDGGFDGCGPAWCNPGCCLERPRFWASAEYLLWWQRAQNVPPLVVSSPPGTNPLLGPTTTTILFDNAANPARSGGRFTLGMWMPHFCNNLGIEVNYFFLGRQSDTAFIGGTGNPQLARPFFDTTPGNVGPNAEVFAGNGVTGSATIHTFSQVWGIEGNLRYKWCCGPNYWLDIIGGFRHLNLSEGIDITEDAQSFQRNGAPGIRFLERESFRTRNQFNGAQLGFEGETRLGSRWFAGMNAKVAIGSVHQIINIDGSTTFSNVPAPFFNSTQPGALLATPTNIGRYTANRFGVLPEVGFKIGYDVTDHLRIFAGYNFLYLNNVVRPGEQIDTNVNQAFRPSIAGPGIGGGPRQPAVLFRTSDYWAQGFNFGLQYRY
jgi:hypothetical protein